MESGQLARWMASQGPLWAMDQRGLAMMAAGRISLPEQVASRVALRHASVVAESVEIQAVAPQAATAAPGGKRGAMVAIVPVYGVLSPRGPEWWGATCEGIQARFRAALADPAVGSIVFDHDSPGGNVQGVPELAAEIRAARGRKPMVAVANPLSASASYFLAAQADQVLAPISADLGSVGCFVAHENIAGLLEKLGSSIEFVVAGDSPRKVDGHPFGPLSDEARADLQGRVDEFMGMFVSALAKGRGVSAEDVRRSFGQGRVLGAREAVAVKMADAMGTLDDAIRLAAKLARQATGAAQAAADRQAAAAELASL